MSAEERTLKNSISQRITLAPKRERGGCAFKRCCEEKCFGEIIQLRTHSRTKDEISNGLALRVEKINLLAQSEGGENFETRNRMAARLMVMLQGAAVPIDYGGTIDYSFCGDRFPIQTYSIEEMRGILGEANLEIDVRNACVSVSRSERATGLSEPFAGLLAWIAALKSPEGKGLERLMRCGGLNGVRAIARIAGEPSIDEAARKKFMDALCRLVSCMSIRDGQVHAKNEELAHNLSRFSTIENYSFTSSGMMRKRECGGRPLLPPEITLRQHRMMQMARICIEGLFQANMNIANRIDSIINSGDAEIEENSERLRGMYESLKSGLVFLLDGDSISAESLEILADGKINELYGPVPVDQRGKGMDPGEQNIVRYSVSRLEQENALDAESVKHLDRVLATSEAYPEEIAKKMERFLSA